MTIPRFEGSFLGDTARIAPDAVLECKICWHVYDPAKGCDDWQIPPGTPFAALPDHWRCPKCDGDRAQFMVIDAGSGVGSSPTPPSAELWLQAAAKDLAQRLKKEFREIHVGQMRGVPLVNETLEVEAVGFRPHDGRLLGILITPWFMNIVVAPGPDEDWSSLVPGTRELIEFPSGRYEFVGANRPGTGPYKACSLFSPMFEFTSMLQASETASAALTALFDPAIREDDDDEVATAQTERHAHDEGQRNEQAAERVPSRRALIFGAGLASGQSEIPL